MIGVKKDGFSKMEAHEALFWSDFNGLKRPDDFVGAAKPIFKHISSGFSGCDRLAVRGIDHPDWANVFLFA